MRILLLLVIGIFMVGCKDEVLNAENTRRELQGMWLLQDSTGSEVKHATLYFNDRICHFFYDQNNSNRYEIRDSILDLKMSISRSGVGSHIKFKILSIGRGKMNLLPLDSNLRDYFSSNGIDTLKFFKTKQKNNLKYQVISFGSSGCFGSCQSFDLELNASGEVLYEGFSFVKKKGKYMAGRDQVFDRILRDKMKYVDLEKLDRKYEAPWTDDQTVCFIVETPQKNYETYVYGTDQEPSEIRAVFTYIFSNYESLSLVKNKSGKELKYGRALSQMRAPELEDIIKFLPPEVEE